MTERQYSVRQAILAALTDRYPGGRDLPALESAPDCQASAAQRDDLLREAAILRAGGFIADLRPGRQPFWKVTYSGLRQIRREATPDELVWGTSAL